MQGPTLPARSGEPALSAFRDNAARARRLRGLRRRDAALAGASRSAAVLVLLLVAGLVLALAYGAMPALRAFGASFLVEQTWNPVTERFGALAPIYGTLVTSSL